jgi:hypothetical protein
MFRRVIEKKRVEQVWLIEVIYVELLISCAPILK